MKKSKTVEISNTKLDPTGKPAYTRITAIAETIKSGTVEIAAILTKSDALYVKKTGRNSNPKETKWNWAYVRATLTAFGMGEESEGNFTLKG